MHRVIHTNEPDRAHAAAALPVPMLTQDSCWSSCRSMAPPGCRPGYRGQTGPEPRGKRGIATAVLVRLALIDSARNCGGACKTCSSTAFPRDLY